MRAFHLLLGVALLAGVGGAVRADPPAAASPAAPATPAPAVIPLGGGHIFISPMGQPFHTEGGVSAAEQWFRGADANHDDRISPQEFQADATRFFATLDTDRDGMIGPDEIDHYESVVAPEIRVLSTYGDPSLAKTDADGKIVDPPYPTRLGAGRFGFLDAPEPVVSADLNFDRAISVSEFQTAATRRFRQLDANGDGVLTRDELPRLDTHPERRNGRGNRAIDDHGGKRHHGGGAGGPGL